MRRSCPYIRHLLLQLLNSWLWIEWLVLECIILAILVSTFHLKVICLMNSSTFLKNAREYLAIDHYLGSAIFHGFMCTYLIYEMTHEHQDYTCLDKAYYGLGTSYFSFEKIGLFCQIWPHVSILPCRCPYSRQNLWLLWASRLLDLWLLIWPARNIICNNLISRLQDICPWTHGKVNEGKNALSIMRDFIAYGMAEDRIGQLKGFCGCFPKKQEWHC